MRHKFLLFIFVTILLLPVLDNIFHFAPVQELFEKRLPASIPAAPKNFGAAIKWPQDFEKYYNDNYGLRKSLISFNSHMMDKVFNESPDARAVIGKDEWLYFDNHNSLLDAIGKATLSDELVARGVESFGRNWHFMQDKGIDYLLVIAADKSSIYPEFLPDSMQPKGPHRIDKFLTALKQKYPDFPVLDLRPLLLEVKKNEIIYHKTDTHWNKRGAHYGYVAIMKALKIKPRLRDEFINDESGITYGDIAQIMGLYLINKNYDLVPKNGVTYKRSFDLEKQESKFHKPVIFETANKNLPVLFAYKDSFFGYMTEFTPGHFSRSYYVNEFPCDLNYEILKKFHPNIVIQEFWEGRVEVVLSQCQQ